MRRLVVISSLRLESRTRTSSVIVWRTRLEAFRSSYERKEAWTVEAYHSKALRAPLCLSEPATNSSEPAFEVSFFKERSEELSARQKCSSSTVQGLTSRGPLPTFLIPPQGTQERSAHMPLWRWCTCAPHQKGLPSSPSLIVRDSPAAVLRPLSVTSTAF